MAGARKDDTRRTVTPPKAKHKETAMARDQHRHSRQLEGTVGREQRAWMFVQRLLSGVVSTVSQNVVSSWKEISEGRREEGGQCMSRLLVQSPMIVPYVCLSASPGSGAAGDDGSVARSGGSAVANGLSPEVAADSGAEDLVDFSGFGPAFIGQVFTMCDTSRRGLIAVRADSVKSSLPSFLPPFVSNVSANWIRKALGRVLNQPEGPVFRFYFDKDEAAAYVKRLNLNGSTVGSCPLEAAYKYFKGKPPMFRFVPDRKQVKVAKELLRKAQGKNAARSFKGVPVFTARNLTIAMSTPGGVRWFTPYFFDKKQVDSLVGHSVDHYYQMLIYARHLQRHSQVDVDFPGEMGEEDPDGLLDPMEVQEFMEEMGQGASGLDSVIVKAAEVHFEDMLDIVLLGNKWSRNLAGLQPSFPVVVDSFERRAAAAEFEAVETANQDAAKPVLEEDHRPKDSGGGESSSMSGKNLDGKDNGRGLIDGGSFKKRFQSFGKNWGFNLDGGRDGRKTSAPSSRTADGGPREADSDTSSMDQSFQPKLTMMGIAMNGPVNDIDKAMAKAAQDIEDRIRKGEGSGREHRPLFIADLGGPLNFETSSS